MTATLITKHAIPHTNAGYAFTDSADFATLSTGSGNGVDFAYEDDLLVALKNDTGGSATFTLKIPANAQISTNGGSITSPTRVVADGKTFLMRLDKVFRDGATGLVTIECNVAGKVLVLDP